jgi:hypothetical protein
MILELEKQVCSFELAKKLGELGVPQESLFYWGNTIGQTDQTCWRIYSKEQKENFDTMMEYYSAYTVAELGKMISDKQPLPEMNIVGDWCWGNLLFEMCSEADARAELLIFLIEKNIIDIKILQLIA